MSNISQDKLLEIVDNRYSLVVLAAKRAKQIRENAGRLISTDSTNPLTVALEEISSGKIGYDVADHDEPITAEVEEPELLGLPEVPEAEDILPIPAEESAEEDELPAAEAAEAEAEETPVAEAEVPAEMETPESTATEQASQPED